MRIITFSFLIIVGALVLSVSCDKDDNNLTNWSCIYNPKELTIHFYNRNDTSKLYVIDLKKDLKEKYNNNIVRYFTLDSNRVVEAFAVMDGNEGYHYTI